MTDLIDPEEIVRIAKTWAEAPFKYQGRSKEGTDCGGPVFDIAVKVGACSTDLSYERYGKVPDQEVIKQLVEEHSVKRVGEPRRGDILIFAIDHRGVHVGVMVSDTTFLHATAKAGRVMEHYLRPPWSRRVLGAYRLVKLDE